MQEWVITIGAAVCMFGILMPAYLHMKQGKHTTIALTLKGACTFVAVALCFIGALHSDTAGAWWMALGLSFCLVGDVVLGIHFVGGVGAFMLGHLCYITAFVSFAPISPWSGAVFFCVIALLILLFIQKLKTLGKQWIPLSLYAMVIAAMLSIAVMMPSSMGLRGVLPAAGAALFVLSDCLLARNMFVRATRLCDGVSLTCYYAGQYLLALSVYLAL